MFSLPTKARAAVLCAATLLPSLATAADRPSQPQLTRTPVARLLSIASRLRRSALDCSHLVQDLYRRAGLQYDYANSFSIFKGEAEEFRRVIKPQVGDLIVWQ